jgi:hypothetical protein
MTINTPIARPIPKGIDISSSPEGTTVGFTVGGDVFTTDFKYTEYATPITFTATGDTEDFILYEWDFGDGTRGFGNPIVHTYLIDNPHLQVKVRATTTDENIVIASRRIYIQRASASSDGLYPSNTLYPASSRYPES